MTVDSREIDKFLVELLQNVGKSLRDDALKKKSVDTKKNRNDLVTNFDKKTERYVNSELKRAFSEATIVSEEGYGDLVTDMSGLVFFVDPIDGTMNFVKRGDDFASMIGAYIDGKPLIGAIIDVMGNNIYHGGKEIGLFINDERIDIPRNLPLVEGLVDVSAPMALANKFNVQDVIKKSSGFRVYGSAGIIFGHLLTGKEVMYMSYLAPWDLAAGRVLCEAAGMSVVSIDDAPINMLKSQVVIVGTQKVVSEALTTVKTR
ncbi:fructose-1 6-bisphosphatase [Companilactobacillus paralimentarius DSM 13238 = JCM 10415]|uniref:Fructose-1 6-bisphosphatase n=1 Tax=Companilactobacillus paralimentarius DSM 13238 = JCM 10415 TaxID=1122151 RepID=A0A0R1PJ80_9LACO|nr:inositol monophosphatase family protein [Companilactobacillus paralimentarius]KAE9564041.1 fructose 1,6-bisphosphatase [Companilactobacillus paralimentarius]KRL32233.1 fructose-1 6-bisphosphatase [Companilactobacillus paralimentarius DSM 13238 = JCM 10415]QFR70208.1 inositol monophosphatase family protein [Companilactobacillus paralimentarius]